MNNIVLIGMPGSGKSTIGKSLAKQLHMQFIDTDEKLESDQKRKIPEIFANDGEETFRMMESKCVLECSKLTNTVIATGGGVVLRDENMKALAENGRIVWLNRPMEDLLSTNLTDRPLVANDNSRLHALYAQREPLYRKYAQITMKNHGSPYSVVTRLRRILPWHCHLAVIGDPIAHTKSPQIHHAMANACGLDVYYEACHVTRDGIPDFLKKVQEEKIRGFNVTIPHKSAIIPYLTEIDPYAASCGAVNTVVVKNGQLYGYNTDGDGILHALKRLNAVVKGKTVLLLGAGGAALSICRRCVLAGAAKVIVLARTAYKAEAMEYVGGVHENRVFGDEMTTEKMQQYAASADVVINATPLGMSGIDADFTDFGFLDALPENAVVYDIVYKPAETTLLKECGKRGIRCGNGLSMLIYQAIEAFKLFTGAKLDTEKMYETVWNSLQQEKE